MLVVSLLRIVKKFKLLLLMLLLCVNSYADSNNLSCKSDNSQLEGCTFFKEKISAYTKKYKSYGKGYLKLKSCLDGLSVDEKKADCKKADDKKMDVFDKAVECANNKKDFVTPDEIDWLVIPIILKKLEYLYNNHGDDECSTVKSLYNYRYWRDPYYIIYKKKEGNENREQAGDYMGRTGREIRKALLNNSCDCLRNFENNAQSNNMNKKLILSSSNMCATPKEEGQLEKGEKEYPLIIGKTCKTFRDNIQYTDYISLINSRCVNISKSFGYKYKARDMIKADSHDEKKFSIDVAIDACKVDCKNNLLEN